MTTLSAHYNFCNGPRFGQGGRLCGSKVPSFCPPYTHLRPELTRQAAQAGTLYLTKRQSPITFAEMPTQGGVSSGTAGRLVVTLAHAGQRKRLALPAGAPWDVFLARVRDKLWLREVYGVRDSLGAALERTEARPFRQNPHHAISTMFFAKASVRGVLTRPVP